MRPIKFRGKSSETNDLVKKGEWIYGYLIAPDQIMVWSVKNSTGRALQIDPKTVGQSTGLEDKNGKELDWWKDDILEHSKVGRRRIGWDNEQGLWRLFKQGGVRSVTLYKARLHNYWKIGNVHDNPGLLEEKK